MAEYSSDVVDPCPEHYQERVAVFRIRPFCSCFYRNWKDSVDHGPHAGLLCWYSFEMIPMTDEEAAEAQAAHVCPVEK